MQGVLSDHVSLESKLLKYLEIILKSFDVFDPLLQLIFPVDEFSTACGGSGRRHQHRTFDFSLTPLFKS